jgi:UDP-N-acetylmuramoyl-tripeptide--D-alanyl-D-alanine ligase
VTILIQLVSLALLLAWARPALVWAMRGLHMLQLEEYQTIRFGRWLAANLRLALAGWLLAALGMIALGSLVLGTVLPWPLGLVVPLVGIAVGIWWSVRDRLPEAKKPLVLTARAKRLLAGWVLCALIALALVALLVARALGPRPDGLVVGVAVGLLLVVLTAWPLQLVANLLLYPVEAAFRAYYLSDARRVLGAYRPTVIGVAGSYGKTSTKTILGQILGAKEPTLATPRSFNTPMGLCRVIREQLQPTHRFFIAELGAYQRGEIRDLCRLVRPTIGVLTAVGPEHLERFGSMENVREAEFELIAALPPDGLAVFNGYDATCLGLSARATCRKLIVGGPDPDLWAEDVRLSSDGLGFDLCLRDGRRAGVTTRLLGRHNVANVLAASAVALECGIAFDDLPGLIRRLDPVEHRLQLIPNPNGVVVIDDTYNSNPRGAEAALETLASFQGGRRYLVTPGMVELADLQDEAHRAFGEQAAKVCDRVILIGPRRTRAIADGLAAAGFGQERLIVTRSLAEATDHLKTLLRPGDAVLFENDLPDHYSE